MNEIKKTVQTIGRKEEKVSIDFEKLEKEEKIESMRKREKNKYLE